MSDNSLGEVKKWSINSRCMLIPYIGDDHHRIGNLKLGQSLFDGCFGYGKSLWGQSVDNMDYSWKAADHASYYNPKYDTVCCWHPEFSPVNCSIPVLVSLGACCALNAVCMGGFVTLSVFSMKAMTLAKTAGDCALYSCVAGVGIGGTACTSMLVDGACSVYRGAGFLAIPCIPIAMAMFYKNNVGDMRHSFPATVIKGCTGKCFAICREGLLHVYHSNCMERFANCNNSKDVIVDQPRKDDVGYENKNVEIVDQEATAITNQPSPIVNTCHDRDNVISRDLLVANPMAASQFSEIL